MKRGNHESKKATSKNLIYDVCKVSRANKFREPLGGNKKKKKIASENSREVFLI